MKQITISYEDKKYTLEYTRKSVEYMERTGFVISELDSKPGTMIPLMFTGAFHSKYKFMQKDIIDTIYNDLKNKDEVIQALSEMYQDTLMSMISNTDENQGNIEWEKNW